MFKNARKFKFMALLSMSTLLFTGCFGSMALTKKIYTWNDGVSGNKIVKTLIFWGMIIVPIYEIAGFVDVVFLNTVEFWTGSNPIAMGAGEKEVQIVTNENNETFEITATQNRFDIRSLDGEHNGQTMSYIFNSDERAWYKKDGETLTKISQMEDNNMVSLFAPDGTVITKELN